MKQIIALGGGGFSMEPENPLLDTYIVKQAGKPNPKICFIPTASGDSLQKSKNLSCSKFKKKCKSLQSL